MAISSATWHLTANEVYPRQAIYGFQLAPDGRQIVFVQQRDQQVGPVENDGQKQFKITPLADLCLLPADGGYPRALTTLGDLKHPATWSPDGKWLAFERRGLCVMPVTGGEMRVLYKGTLYHPPLAMGDASRGLPCWSPDGDWLLFATRDAPRTALRLVSFDGRTQRELLSVVGYIISWDWAPDGRQIVIVTRYEDGWLGDVRVVDVETGAERVLLEQADYEYQKPVAAWSPGGEVIVLRSNRSGYAKLWTIRPDGSDLQPLTFGDWDEYAFCFSPDGEQIVVASRADQPGSGDDLWVVPLNQGQARRLTRQPGVNVPLAWSGQGRVFYWHSSPTEPGDLWTVGIRGDAPPTRLSWSAPLTLQHKLSAPEEVTLSSKDGTAIPTLVYRPTYYQEGEHYPAIVWIRGGPTGVCRVDYRPFYNWLANLGYIVITPNYRGSVGYGIAHMTAVAGEGLGKNDLSDVLAAGRYARTRPDVDLSRGVGVGGRSWGGYLTLMAVTLAPEEFSCAVAGAAITDWCIQQSQTEVRYYDHWLVGGWVYERVDRARDRSPVNFVERIQTPLFVFHGEDDRDVPFAQIESFVEKARQIEVEVEYITYPAEGHSNKKPENQQHTLARMQLFFRQHLQPWNLRDNPCASQVQY
jgi:dipeptidyl aminopeptidase/acylaminoacyl peptidase